MMADNVHSPVAVSTITVKLVHFADGQVGLETFWSGPIAQELVAVASVLRQAAAQIDAQRSPLFIPGHEPGV